MAQKKDPKRDRIFALNSNRVLRIYPELAEEIELNESIVLLQLDFLISIAGDDNFKDGRWWTYQSLRDLRDNYFPWWSPDTISRALKKLEASNFILIGNYNRRRNDKTQWFALNFDELAKLKSISIAPRERGRQRLRCTTTQALQAVRISDRVSENRTGASENAVEVSENAVKLSEDRTTLPESPEMISEREGAGAPASQKAHQELFETLVRACRWELNFLSEKRRSQLNRVSQQLREQEITPAQVEAWLEGWYAHDWRGKKGDPPDNPQVILDNWARFRDRPAKTAKGFAEASYKTPVFYDEWGNRL